MVSSANHLRTCRPSLLILTETAVQVNSFFSFCHFGEGTLNVYCMIVDLFIPCTDQSYQIWLSDLSSPSFTLQSSAYLPDSTLTILIKVFDIGTFFPVSSFHFLDVSSGGHPEKSESCADVRLIKLKMGTETRMR